MFQGDFCSLLSKCICQWQGHLKSSLIFVQLGLNEADTFKSSSILIYSSYKRSVYTQNGWHELKHEIKRWQLVVGKLMWHLYKF
jgi:hypothetical protein